MGTISDEIHHVPCSIGFSIFATEEIRKLSKVEITSVVSVNDLGQPLPGGLYDLSMGPYMRDFGVCSTCHLNFMHCPGHLGHIELVVPVINPLLRSVVFKLLSRTCLRCSALLYPGSLLVLTQVQLELLEMGLAAEALTAADMVSATAKKTKVDRNLELVDLADTGVAANTDQSTNKLLSYLSEVKDQHARGSIVREVRNVVLERRAVIQRFLAHKPSKTCPSCQHTQPSLNDFGGQIIRIDLTSSRKKKSTVAQDDDDSRSYVTASEARQVLRKLWTREKTLLCHVFGMLNTVKGNEHPTDCFFLEVLPVTAPRFRPMDNVNGRTVEHTQTYVYATIVECSRLLRQLVTLRRSGDSLDSLPAEQQRQLAAVRGDTLDDKVMRCWRNLQGLVDCVVDTDMSRAMSNRLNSTNLRGIKQVLEKKDGIFRMNMMGKRVDFAGRTVITPDPYLSVEEMGVPEVMAMKLTYPEPVTPQNLTVLQRAVLNGPNKHPGANAIQLATGVKVVLRNDPKQLASIAASLLTPSEEQSRKLMGPKIVHRHLLTGDAVLLNRQPTLHRPSIMAHRVRVLPGEKTFRLHYSNCKSYNADFDGDEMNMHLPQGEEGRSEAYNLMFSPNHYLVPKDGTPLGGLIQDHVVAGVRLTMRGTFFERAEYQQLVASGLGEHRQRVRLLPPAVLRPRRLWTGKQVVSTIIVNLTPADWPAINLRSTSKLSHKIWQQQRPRPCTAGGAIVEPDMSEGEVIIRGGHLLCGVLDKQQFGAVPFSLVHGFYELYGGVVSSRLLSGFSRLFTCCLHRMGFTLGVKDILVTAAADRQRRDVIGKSVQIGVEAAADALGLVSQETRHDPAEVRRRLEQVHLSGSARATRDLDRAYKQRLDTINNNINKVCLPAGLIQSFPDNNLQLMVESGAKGSKVNAMQISCLLGQIELEGKRPPRMVSGKTLPSFEPYDLTPRAGGFIASRFMTGIRPQEYFFHCMAGREGLIDTAVKTSRSGYLQRCLIKHLEGLVVNYDSTVRDSDGSVIQFRYGEDGCETQKMPYLTQKQMTFFDDNHRGILDSRLVDSFKRRSDLEGIRKHRKKVRKWCREFGDPRAHRRTSQFLEFCRLTSIPDQQQRHRTTNRPLSYHHAVKMWHELDNTKLFRSRCRRCPDPVDSVYPPSSHFSSMCERLEAMIGDYLESRPDPSAELEDLLRFKVATATVQPGEAVGLIAGQSVGEPSTQMTLNTFHFAGLGDMNVTLGIPRLREILSASKSLKTPSMEIPFRKDVPDVERRANRLKLQLSRVTLAQVLRDVTVTERCLRGQTRVYQLRMCFLPRSAYKEEFAVRPADVLRYVEDVWIRRFLKLLAKTFKLKDVGSVMEKERRAAAKDSSESAEAADEGAEGEEAVDEPSTSDQKTPTEDEEISDGEAGQDDDATTARSRARRNDEAEYESEEEEEEEESFAEMDLQEDDDEEDLMGAQRNKGPTSVKARTETVLTLALDNCRVKSYTFDEKRNLWCQFTIAVSTSRQCDIQTLVTEAAGIAVIREVPSISRVFVIKDEKHGLRLCTEGINMAYFARFSDLLDLNRMYCNDVHSMASTYGIEAATTAVVKEITSVFEVYGIQVSRRHLSLIADYMTFSGVVRGFTRWAMDSVVSPLQQMSFETTVNFLRTAILAGQVDDLRSPSARLVLGQPMIGGTGMFSLVNKMIVDDYL